MKLVFIIGIGLLFLIVIVGCGHSQSNDNSMPNMHASITWKGKTYNASNHSVKKNKVKGPIDKNKPHIYKIKDVPISKAIALKKSVYYWKYIKANSEGN